jgi:PAS domain S-box-containing protein
MKIENSYTDEILDSIAEGLFTVDKNFRIIFFNQAAETITGYKREEVLGRFCKHIFKSSLCFTKCPIAQVLESDQNIFDIECQIKHKNSKKIPIKLNSAVLRNDENDPVGGVVSFRDITLWEQIRDELDNSSDFFGIVGKNKLMKEMYELIREISDTDVTILIQGESGTGKEMIANAVQASSLRARKPFIKVNCSVFPPQLLASELFGHVKGAFTGAIKDRVGRFELANNGTLFLDEVGEMPLEMQLQLLRVLQEGTFERVGESLTRKVDVRVIAATNSDIQKAIEKGSFREDLFYRLNVIPIIATPLRDRPDDIPALVKHFIKKNMMIYKKNIQDIDDDAMDLLLQHNWPGNIRELENVISYAFARTKNSVIQAIKLPPQIREHTSSLTLKNENKGKDEYKSLVNLLEEHQWNRTKVAQEMGIGRTTLWRKLRIHGLDTP